jgi:hypothetical protein
MLAAATPANRKQISAMMVIALVNRHSVSVRNPPSIPRKLGNN